MHSPSVLLFLLTLPFTLAEPSFITPVGGSSLSAGTITVSWKDGGSAPSISDLSSYQLLLYTGSNSKPFQLADLKAGSFSEGNTVSATIQPSVGGASPENAYFVGMIATARAGGSITVFSDRFTLKGMTGIFPAAVQSDLASISGTSGPQPVNVQIEDRELGQRQEASYAIPYPLQDGLTKYAPMQAVPGTSITAVNTSPLYPSSSVVLASTYLPIPTVVTTLTQAQTFEVASHPNSAAPASQPTGDMAKFLNRWKD